MKKALLTILVCLSCSFYLLAQYKKGSIRLPSGEMISGYLQHDTEVKLKERVFFKTALSKSEYKRYSPNEIAGFFFEKGPSFEAIETSYIEESILFKERAFAKRVATGVIDLYLSQTRVEEDDFIFYARKDGRLHQLIQDKINLNPTGDTYTTVRNYYQGVLNALTYDCRRRIGDVKRLPFSRRGIVELVNNYNACQDPDYKPMQNAYQVAKERRYFVEFFGGPLIGKRNFGAPFGNDRIVRKEVFAMVGVGAQMEVYKPSLSRNLLVHNSLEAYKWVSLEESGIIDPPALSLALNIAAHYMINEEAKVKFFTRLGGAFTVDLGQQILPRPGISLGLGAYFPSGNRVSIQLATLSILGTEGLTTWRLGYGMPLAVIQE